MFAGICTWIRISLLAFNSELWSTKDKEQSSKYKAQELNDVLSEQLPNLLHRYALSFLIAHRYEDGVFSGKCSHNFRNSGAVDLHSYEANPGSVLATTRFSPASSRLSSPRAAAPFDLGTV